GDEERAAALEARAPADLDLLRQSLGVGLRQATLVHEDLREVRAAPAPHDLVTHGRDAFQLLVADEPALQEEAREEMFSHRVQGRSPRAHSTFERAFQLAV